eukprot:COSAG02_NODE_75_length_41389_cov_106.665762_28_plen_398_part_00
MDEIHAVHVEKLWSRVFGSTTQVHETVEAGSSTGAEVDDANLNGAAFNGDSWTRHSLQTRAIALNLAAAGLLKPQPTSEGVLSTVEFGAAVDATLSEQVRTVAGPRVPLRQILVDRDAVSARTYGDAGPAGHERLGDANSCCKPCERLTIDIAELDLPAVLGTAGSADVVVGMAKHLCGPAYDAALRVMLSVAETHPGQLGVAMVGCCYGACDWKSCCGSTQDFFTSHGVDEAGFQLICKTAGNLAAILHRIAAAATTAASEVALVLGAVDTVATALQAERAAALAIAQAVDTAVGRNRATEDSAQIDVATAQCPANNSISTPALAEIAEIGLAAARRVAFSETRALRVAVKAKRLMDEGRRRALESAGFEAKVLGEVVPHAISVENTLLLALRPSM